MAAETLSGRAAIVHDLALEDYGFGGDHPFNPLRLRLALELCEALGLLEDYPFVSSGPATDEDLTTVHSLTYVRMVQEAGRDAEALSDLLQYGLGTPDNPVFPDMHEACASVVGGVLAACRLVMAGEVDHAMCISGGLHHALRSQGKRLLRLQRRWGRHRAPQARPSRHPHRLRRHRRPPRRRRAVDVLRRPRGPDRIHARVGPLPLSRDGRDQGDGLQGGAGFCVNVPLEPFTDDESWISCFEAVVPDVLRAFEPDLILSQNGCDGHALDPLTHLCATTRLYKHVPRRVHDLAHELCGGRWVASGGGGYDIWRVVPRAWTALWATVSHQEMPESVDEQLALEVGPEEPGGNPPLMRDEPEDYPQRTARREDSGAQRAHRRAGPGQSAAGDQVV